MKNFTTTETKAIILAKNILKQENNIKRLAYSKINSTSCQCDCGETHAVNVIAKIGNNWVNHTVGICKVCSNN